jgi:16S rRNA (adenine1518-N6/adenine1519-N6)-dimethyltransferase
MPAPNVDSAVIKLNILPEPPIKVTNEKKFFSLVKACFAQRRKTLVNTVSNTLGIEKETLRNALLELGLSDTVRGEALTMEELAKLSEKIK